MSRSYKKHPVYTDGHRCTTKETKQKANRRVRRRNKRIVNGYFNEESRYEDLLTLDGKSYIKFFPSWDIHDYVSWWSIKAALCEFEHPNWIYDKYRNEWYHSWSDFNIYEFISYWEKYYKRK